jgi:hypothetical protein
MKAKLVCLVAILSPAIVTLSDIPANCYERVLALNICIAPGEAKIIAQTDNPTTTTVIYADAGRFGDVCLPNIPDQLNQGNGETEVMEYDYVAWVGYTKVVHDDNWDEISSSHHQGQSGGHYSFWPCSTCDPGQNSVKCTWNQIL